MFLFKDWFNSLYSSKNIALKRFERIGRTIQYVFFLSLIAIIPASIYASQDAIRAANDFEQIVKTTIPEFEIVNGKLTSPVTEPTTLVYNTTYILFDPTGEWDTSELNKYHQSIGLLKDALAYNFGGTIQTIPYTMLSEIISSKDGLITFVEKGLSILPILIALIIIASYLFSTAVKFIEISVMAFFGLLFINILNREIPYRKIWLLGAYSITLAVTFLTLMDLLNITVVYSYFVYWFVSLTMLYLALREVPSAK